MLPVLRVFVGEVWVLGAIWVEGAGRSGGLGICVGPASRVVVGVEEVSLVWGIVVGMSERKKVESRGMLMSVDAVRHRCSMEVPGGDYMWLRGELRWGLTGRIEWFWERAGAKLVVRYCPSCGHALPDSLVEFYVEETRLEVE